MTIYLFNECCEPKTQTVPVILQDAQQWRSLSLPIHEIFKYYENGREIWLVLPAKLCSIHQVELPKLSRKDVIPAIVSILEDSVLQDFQDLHCFFQGAIGKAGIFQVGLIEKTKLNQIQDQWNSLGILFTGITLDWYALNDNEVLLLPDGDGIANIDNIKGWVSKSLVPNKVIQSGLHPAYYSCLSCPYPIQFNNIGDNLYQWVAERIVKNQRLFDIRMLSRKLPFLEGISNSQIKDVFLKFVVGFGIFTLIVDAGFFVKNFIHYRHQKQILQSYTEVATDSLEQKLLIYRQQLAQKNKFWVVFNGLQQAMMPGIHIKHFDYTQEHLKINITALEMPLFQNFKRRLFQAHLDVQESQVQVSQEGVQANLDLRARS